MNKEKMALDGVGFSCQTTKREDTGKRREPSTLNGEDKSESVY